MTQSYSNSFDRTWVKSIWLDPYSMTYPSHKQLIIFELKGIKTLNIIDLGFGWGYIDLFLSVLSKNEQKIYLKRMNLWSISILNIKEDIKKYKIKKDIL